MTVEQHPSGRPPLFQITPATAIALLTSPSPPLIVDARTAASHALERVRGALSSPSPSALSGRQVVFYDAGATCLSQSFSLAVSAINRYAESVCSSTRLALISGGLPAIRALAPGLVEVDASSPVLRRKVRGMPWALRVLDQVGREGDGMGCVLPWLYVGGVVHAYGLEGLCEGGFTHVVVVGGELKKMFGERFCYLQVGARDCASYPLKKHFVEIVTFLDALEKKVGEGGYGKCLVHCFAGASRSVAAVVAYLIWRGMGLKGALALVKERRRAADPNEGFLKQLAEWEEEVREGLHRNLPRVEEWELAVPGGGRQVDGDENCGDGFRDGGEVGDRGGGGVQRGKVCVSPLAISNGMAAMDWRSSLPLTHSPMTPQGRREGEGVGVSKGLRMCPPNCLALPRAFDGNGLVDSNSINSRLTSSSGVAAWTERLSDNESDSEGRFVDLVDAGGK